MGRRHLDEPRLPFTAGTVRGCAGLSKQKPKVLEPSREELLESVRIQRCWWCGRNKSARGREFSSLSRHWLQAHGIRVQAVREFLAVPLKMSFVSDGLKQTFRDNAIKHRPLEHVTHARRGAYNRSQCWVESLPYHVSTLNRENRLTYGNRLLSTVIAPMSRKALILTGREFGMSDGAAWQLILRLVRQGRLRRVGRALYSR